MTTFSIPVLASSSRPTVRQRVKLDGRDYLLDFSWNGRESRWYVTVLDADGVLICGSRKVVVGGRIANRTADPRAPLGVLCAVDVSGSDIDPGIDDLGERVVLGYFDAADIAAIEAAAAAEEAFGVGGGAGEGGGGDPLPFPP